MRAHLEASRVKYYRFSCCLGGYLPERAQLTTHVLDNELVAEGLTRHGSTFVGPADCYYAGAGEDVPPWFVIRGGIALWSPDVWYRRRNVMV